MFERKSFTAAVTVSSVWSGATALEILALKSAKTLSTVGLFEHWLWKKNLKKKNI